MVAVQQLQIVAPLRIQIERRQRERRRAGVIGEGVVGDRRAHADLGGTHHEVVFLLVAEAELFTEAAVIREHRVGDEHVVPDAGRAEVELRQCPAERLPVGERLFLRRRTAAAEVRQRADGRVV